MQSSTCLLLLSPFFTLQIFYLFKPFIFFFFAFFFKQKEKLKDTSISLKISLCCFSLILFYVLQIYAVSSFIPANCTYLSVHFFMRFGASSFLSVIFYIHINPPFFSLPYLTHYPNYAILIRVAVLCIMNMLSDNNAGPQPMAHCFFVIETRRHIDLTDLFSISATLDFQRWWICVPSRSLWWCATLKQASQFYMWKFNIICRKCSLTFSLIPYTIPGMAVFRESEGRSISAVPTAFNSRQSTYLQN
jgi:hypothetical protein